MLIRKCVIIMSMLGIAAAFSQTASPPNDNFADRIVLTGTSITFTGTLAGATAEYWNGHDEPYGYPLVALCCGPTVWWEWTAPNSNAAALVLERISSSSAFTQMYNGIAVYKNCAGFPTNNFSGCPGNPVNGMSFDPAMSWQCLSFLAEAGVTYFLVLSDGSSGAPSEATYRMSLTASNEPVIFEPPKTQTVGTNASALFTVLASGIPPLSYQWRFNDTDLSGETNSSLAFNAVTTSAEGSYSVVVSNALGSTTSQPAFLYISRADVSPLLSAIGFVGSNAFQFWLTGETGRHYRIETSSDLLGWSPEKSFPLQVSTYYYKNFTSVIFNSNGSALLSVPGNSNQEFVRASRYCPSNEICNNNLRQIRFAKDCWILEQHKVSSDTPRTSDLFPRYMKEQYCPQGGIYYLNDAAQPPICTISNHVLEVPR